MKCRDATQLMSERLDRPLGGGERLQLGLHLLICRGCRNFGDQMRFLHEACARFPLEADRQAEAEHRG